MRYLKTRNQWVASNFKLDLDSGEAYSYEWYCLLKKVNGKLILNTYNYSPSTVKHIYKLRSLLEQLNIKVDLEIEAPDGLQDLDSAIRLYKVKIDKLQDEIDKPRSHKIKNVERRLEIGKNIHMIHIIEDLIREI